MIPDYLGLTTGAAQLIVGGQYPLINSTTIEDKITTAKYFKSGSKIKITWDETSSSLVYAHLFIAQCPDSQILDVGTPITIVALNENPSQSNPLEYTIQTDGNYVLGYSDLIKHSTIEVTIII